MDNQDKVSLNLNLEQILERGFTTALEKLKEFSFDANLLNKMEIAFGKDYNSLAAAAFISSWQSGDFSNLPKIEILPTETMNGANGGFASSNNTIYLSEGFLSSSTIESIATVIVEEIGHFVDSQINTVDAAGDEGQLFAALVEGKELTEAEIASIKAEDDTKTLANGLQIEANEEVNIEWIEQLGSSNIDYSVDVAVAGDSSVYIIGDTKGNLGGTNAGSDDIWLAKYDSEQNQVWVKQLGTASADQSKSVAVDGDGNIYVTGITQGSLEEGATNAGGKDAWVAKYDAEGNLVWLKQLGTASDEESLGLAVDNSGSVYLSGYTKGILEGVNPGGKDAWVAKYDTDGNQVWLNQFGTDSDDASTAIGVDGDGNVYLTGTTEGTLGVSNFGSRDSWVAKYDPSNGTQVWIKQLGSSGLDDAKDITVGTDGLYLGGSTNGNLGGRQVGNWDAWLVKYDLDGKQLWKQQIGTEDYDDGYGIGLDGDGNILITGRTLDNFAGTSIGLDDAWLAEFDADGNQLSLGDEEFIQLGTINEDIAQSIAVDSSGETDDIYVAGRTYGQLEDDNFGLSDAWLAKFSDEPATAIGNRGIKLENEVASPLQLVTFELSIGDATAVRSADFTITYDTDILDYVSINLGELTSDWELNVNDFETPPESGNFILTTPGTIKLSLFDNNPPEPTAGDPLEDGSSGILAKISLRVKADVATDILTNLNFQDVFINESRVVEDVTDGSLEVVKDLLQVTNFEATPSGFKAILSRDLNLDALNLYAAEDTTNADLYYVDPSDIILKDSDGNIISGSALWDDATNTITFVKTGGLLSANTYNLTLESGFSANDLDEDLLDNDGLGFITPAGAALDGNGDGVGQFDFSQNSSVDDYVNTFTVEAPTEPILSLPDFSRGPGQVVDVPATAAGIPIRLTNAKGVESVDFDFTYDPDLLDVTGVSLEANLPDSWVLSTDLSTAGVAKISLSGSALTTSATNLVVIDANVPVSATYGESQILKLNSVEVNGGELAAVADEGIHQVAFFADSSGNLLLSSLDASLISRVSTGYESGFDAFPLIDPIIIGDVTSNGVLSSLDGSFVARKSVGLEQTEIPNFPLVVTEEPATEV
jgi:hypothetical protein